MRATIVGTDWRLASQRSLKRDTWKAVVDRAHLKMKTKSVLVQFRFIQLAITRVYIWTLDLELTVPERLLEH